jgi:hypothetical protein
MEGKQNQGKSKYFTTIATMHIKKVKVITRPKNNQ